MGKGRKYGYGDRLLYPPPHHVAGAVTDHLADLDEEDVWSVGAPPAAPHKDSSHHRWRPATGGLSLAFDGAAAAPPGHHRQPPQHQAALASSAPLSVPEWPSAVATGRPLASPGSSSEDHYAAAGGAWVPPHEYLQARRGSSSVLEGAGRTLKGRDITRVRDAVWSRTGFFG